MDYWTFRKKRIPELYVEKIKKALRDNNFDEAIFLFHCLVDNHADSEYFDEPSNFLHLNNTLMKTLPTGNYGMFYIDRRKLEKLLDKFGKVYPVEEPRPIKLKYVFKTVFGLGIYFWKEFKARLGRIPPFKERTH
jgi:hypothetical protein